jgi:hypothetical protein
MWKLPRLQGAGVETTTTTTTTTIMTTTTVIKKPPGGGIITNNRAVRKRKSRGKPLKLGPVKLVRGGGWCDNCNAASSANDQESNDAPFGK